MSGDEPMLLAPARMPTADELAKVSGFARQAAEAMTSIGRTVLVASAVIGGFVRAAARNLDRDYPNAVPVVASRWRQREERRRYGRVLTRAERMQRWRLTWGGLANPAGRR